MSSIVFSSGALKIQILALKLVCLVKVLLISNFFVIYELNIVRDSKNVKK